VDITLCVSVFRLARFVPCLPIRFLFPPDGNVSRILSLFVVLLAFQSRGKGKPSGGSPSLQTPLELQMATSEISLSTHVTCYIFPTSLLLLHVYKPLFISPRIL